MNKSPLLQRLIIRFICVVSYTILGILIFATIMNKLTPEYNYSPLIVLFGISFITGIVSIICIRIEPTESAQGVLQVDDKFEKTLYNFVFDGDLDELADKKYITFKIERISITSRE